MLWASHGSFSQFSGTAFPIFVDSQNHMIPLYARFFQKLSQLAPFGKLRKVHITSCGTDGNSPSDMNHMISVLQLNNIELNFSPNNKLGSALMGHSVTGLDINWLKQVKSQFLAPNF